MSVKLMPPTSECAAVNCKILDLNFNVFGVHCVKLISQSLLKIEVKFGDRHVENYEL
jgi:hypothetical protein